MKTVSSEWLCVGEQTLQNDNDYKNSTYNALYTSGCRIDRKMANVHRLFINWPKSQNM